MKTGIECFTLSTVISSCISYHHGQNCSVRTEKKTQKLFNFVIKKKANLRSKGLEF